MSAEGPTSSDWVTPVAAYLAAALPRETGDGRDGWNDKAMTAWQFGCKALVALGYARPEPWGASRLQIPVRPGQMPRWDDICMVVLAVMSQTGEISYRQADGRAPKPKIKTSQFSIQPEEGWPEPPPPNIAAAHGCGPARVLTPEQAEQAAERRRIAHEASAALVDARRLAPLQEGAPGPYPGPILIALGLVADNAWSEAAELVVWRRQPHAWQMAVTQDSRFAAARERCIDTMPQEIVETLHDLVEITPDEVDAAMAQHERANAELIARDPAQASFDRTVWRERMFRSVAFRAENEIDHLFFAGWRLQVGWLNDADRQRTLPLFHDPLAGQMRIAALEALDLTLPKEDPK